MLSQEETSHICYQIFIAGGALCDLMEEMIMTFQLYIKNIFERVTKIIEGSCISFIELPFMLKMAEY